MKPFRQIITIVCILASFVAAWAEQPGKATCAVNQSTNAELKVLQGKWEGVMVGDEEHQKITVTITSSSLHFHRDANFWFDTTITLPAGKDPKQLHATIKACPPSQADSIGKVVKAFFKIEDATLTLATMGDDTKETAQAFEAAGTRYELRKVQPKSAEPPKTK